MPSERPYRTYSLDALYVLAKDHWNNVHFLQMVLEELAQRTTSAAKKRHSEIGERLAQIRRDERIPGRDEPARSDRAGTDQASSSASHLDELIRLRAEKAVADKRAADLEIVLLQARDTIRLLQQQVATASARGGHSIFRRVGLDEGCPDFVLKAVRTAYRKQLHPDARPAHEKAEAERRFKEAEAVFDTIDVLRGCVAKPGAD
jgi:hypothetical protein